MFDVPYCLGFYPLNILNLSPESIRYPQECQSYPHVYPDFEENGPINAGHVMISCSRSR